MTDLKEQDLKWLKEEHAERLDKKYRAGDAKHGDDLLQLSTREYLEEALEENLDQFVYIMKALESL